MEDRIRRLFREANTPEDVQGYVSELARRGAHLHEALAVATHLAGVGELVVNTMCPACRQTWSVKFDPASRGVMLGDQATFMASIVHTLRGQEITIYYSLGSEPPQVFHRVLDPWPA